MQHSKYNKIDSIYHTDSFATHLISDYFLSILPKNIHSATVLCIGTDRSTGDALGPMTGTLLQKLRPEILRVQGSLDNPVHALNLNATLKELNEATEDTFVIALDASLGQLQSVGQFQYGLGSIMPGTALKKELPSVGDAFITGVINISGMMEYSVLQSTRFSLVYNMAETLAQSLFHIDLKLKQSSRRKAKRFFPFIKINNQYTSL